MKNLLLLAVLAFAGWTAYTQYRQHAHAEVVAPAAVKASMASGQAPTNAFKCDGRTHCSQMTSCAEATYFLQHCPGTRMDGNNDGVPCEKQWCK